MQLNEIGCEVVDWIHHGFQPGESRLYPVSLTYIPILLTFLGFEVEP
jgi:hypothetical protein